MLEKPAGKKRDQLEVLVVRPGGPQALFAGRVLPFDTKRRPHLGATDGRRNRDGRPRSALDMIIAAIAEANDCVVVTDNERDFAGIEIVNPLRKANR